MASAPRRLIHIVASMRRDAIAQYAHNICAAFSADSVSTAVYTRDAKVVDRPFAESGVEIRHLPLRGYFDIGSALGMSRDLRHEPRGTVIHTHRYRDAFTALLARKLARRKDIRVVYTRHKIRRGYDTFLLRRVYRNLDAQIFVSRLARDRFLSQWSSEYPFDPTRLHVIFTSIRGGGDGPLPFRDKGPVTAMYCGPIEEGKGVEILIDALYRLKEVKGRLKIAGTGSPDYIDSLRRRALARGVMEMIDWKINDDDPTDAILDSHFGVMPSVSPEPFGVSNLNFLAAGRAIVATNNGAQTEYLHDGKDSLLVPPANAAALGEALVKLASSRELCASMGAIAFDTFRSRLSWPHFLTRLKQIYFPS